MNLIDKDEILRDTDRYESVAEVLNAIRKAAVYVPPHIPPSNPPLTLEELRELDGEPVWVAAPDGKMFEACWMLVMVRHNFVMANWQVCDFKDYGKTWLAYRRKPEEGTT